MKVQTHHALLLGDGDITHHQHGWLPFDFAVGNVKKSLSVKFDPIQRNQALYQNVAVLFVKGTLFKRASLGKQLGNERNDD